MLRSAIAGALALALVLPAAAGPCPPAHAHAHARLECVGLYCRVVPAPAPRDPLAARQVAAGGCAGRSAAIPARRSIARAWARWGHAVAPAPGGVVVWPLSAHAAGTPEQTQVDLDCLNMSAAIYNLARLRARRAAAKDVLLTQVTGIAPTPVTAEMLSDAGNPNAKTPCGVERSVEDSTSGSDRAPHRGGPFLRLV